MLRDSLYKHRDKVAIRTKVVYIWIIGLGIAEECCREASLATQQHPNITIMVCESMNNVSGQFLLFFLRFSEWSQYPSPFENPNYVWEVSNQLSCGDTYQVWMCKTANFPNIKVSKQSFSDPLLLVLNVGAFSWKPQITFDDKTALIQ